MPEFIPQVSRIEAAGTKPKLIDEVVGAVNSAEQRLSLAHMRSPSGWREPAQRPEFDEWTYVLRGAVEVEHDAGVLEVAAGQAVLVRAGERVRYATPGPEGAEYIAVCLPAFTPERVNREAG